MEQNIDPQKQDSPVPKKKMSNFRKAFIWTTIFIFVFADIGTTFGLTRIIEAKTVWAAFGVFGGIALGLWGLAILSCIGFAITRKRQIALGILSGVGIGFLCVALMFIILEANHPNINTSSVSQPTLDMINAVVLQEGNNLPRALLQIKQSKEIEDNRIGQMANLRNMITSESAAKIFVSQNTKEFGYKWIRLSIDQYDWNQVDWSNGGYSKYYIDSNLDLVVTGLFENDMKIIYTLTFWDVESPGKEQKAGYSRFKTEDEIQRYLEYVRFIVDHFKDRIEYYEILNEPNNDRGTQQYVEVADYINLVKRVVPVIRDEDPEAKIVMPTVSPLSEPGSRDYLFTILDSDVMPLVNVISWHCHNRESPEYAPVFYYNYTVLVQEIRDAASANGFHGEYIAEELHWRTLKNPSPVEISIYSETVSAKYYARGIVMHLGMDITTGLAEVSGKLPLTVRVIRNLCTVMAGAKPSDVSMSIQSSATNIRSYSFSIPDGSQLVALWTDGVGVDDDPGAKSTVTIQDVSARKVMGIDVLNTFEQPLGANIEGRNLVIRDLLIKDYPIFLRLIP
jgi:hypothetical protein